tara:strand:+ start:1323 stop:1874 length:552 start_codon:yes stop_codon:yes gene_type:complete
MKFLSKLFFIFVILIQATQARDLSLNFSVGYIDGLNNPAYTSEYHGIEFTSEMNHDFTVDDDIYFQNGKQVLMNEIIEGQARCAFDTDHVSGNIGYSDPFIEITPRNLSIKAGFKSLVEFKDIYIDWDRRLVVYKFDLINSRPLGDMLDNLSCKFPMDLLQSPNLADLYYQVNSLFKVYSISR